MFGQSGALFSKPVVAVLGTGWAGCYVSHRLNPKLCTMNVLSIRNHMIFTPLLPQTTTGSLEFRSVCEPITNIQRALAQPPHNYYRCMVYDVDFDEKLVKCVGVGIGDRVKNMRVSPFDVKYDYLVLAHGARPNTFNVPGVTENAFFLREVNEAIAIRRRLVENVMAADIPVTNEEEKRRLLHTVVVGGGPTGIEFACNIAEFYKKDVKKIDAALLPYCKVTVVEAGEVLGSFDRALRNYGQHRLKELGIEMIKSAVVGVTDREVFTKDNQVLQCGMVVWSTGVGPCFVTKALQCDKNARGRVSVDDYMRVLRNGAPLENVFAAGDCAAHHKNALPTLAAVANRQGTYVGSQLNHILKTGKMHDKPFVYRSLGSMLALGDASAIASVGKVDINGFKALLVWRSAYLTIIGSVRNKLYVMVNWIGSLIFGRDITYLGDITESRVNAALAEHALMQQREAKQKERQQKATETAKERSAAKENEV